MSNQKKINLAAKAFGLTPKELVKRVNGIIYRMPCYNTRPQDGLFTKENRQLLDALFGDGSVITQGKM